MELSGRIFRQIILLSLVILIVPMLIFPERLGMELVKASFVNALFELTFYAFVIFFSQRKTKLIQLVQMSGACLIYRLTVGLAFGFLIMVMYPMNLSVALSLGMSSYLPAILIHIVATPFILKPIIDEQLGVNVSRVTVPQPESAIKSSGVTITVSKERGVNVTEQVSQATEVKTAVETESSQVSTENEGDGFNKAVRYIGGNVSVKLVAVTDYEGLTLASFKRGELDPDDITPYTMNLLRSNDKQLTKFGFPNPQKIEYIFEDNKIVIAGEEKYCLLVVSERTADDVLNIRINQGLEMIRKYVAERYSKKLIGNAESLYV